MDSSLKNTLKPCFSIYFSSRNPKKATELTEEPLSVHNKSNIFLITSLCISLCITCKISTANVKLIGNLIVSPDTRTVSMARYADTWIGNQVASGLKQQLILCVLSVTEWLVSNGTTRILIGIYKFKNSSKTFLPLRIFASRNLWHPFAEPWGSKESSLRNIALEYLQFRLCQLVWYKIILPSFN
jgi:hypothetical protein